jgi:hypothetical protein
MDNSLVRAWQGFSDMQKKRIASILLWCSTWRTQAMRIETILGKLCRFKGFVFTGCRMDGADRLVLGIRGREGAKALCSKCGKPAPGYDKLPSRLFEFIPAWGLKCFFECELRRVDCPNCGVAVEKVPWSDGKSPLTIHYQSFLAGWAKLLSWKTVAGRFRTSWDSVRRSVATAVEYGLARRRRPRRG